MVWLTAVAVSWTTLAAQPAPAPVTPRGGGIGLISRAIPDAAAVERGKTIFTSACSFCHGSDAKGGDGGPDLIRSVTVLRDEGGNLIGPVVLKGRDGMPKFDFSREQIVDLAAFLRYATQLTIDRRTYELENTITGDAKAGEAYFQGDGQCSRCHSVIAVPGPNDPPTLAGIGARYDVPTLRSQIAYPNLRSAPRYSSSVVRATVTQPDGTVVAGVVEMLDDFDIRVRDEAGMRQTFSRAGPAKIEITDPLAYHEEMLFRITDADLQNLTAFLGAQK